MLYSKKHDHAGNSSCKVVFLIVRICNSPAPYPAHELRDQGDDGETHEHVAEEDEEHAAAMTAVTIAPTAQSITVTSKSVKSTIPIASLSLDVTP